MQRNSLKIRAATVTAFASFVCCVQLTMLGTAHAEIENQDDSSISVERESSSDKSSVTTDVTGNSHIKLDQNHNGSGASMESADESWSPPVCWYEPKFKPKEYKKYLKGAEHNGPHSKGAGIPQKYLDKRKKEKYKKSKDGLWWQLVYNNNDMATEGSEQCDDKSTEIWVPDSEDPPDDVPAVTPEMLSKVAYQSVKLPAPGVKLSPPSGKQVVNFPTHASFDAPLVRTWVTASLNFRGTNIAATTVATPSTLRINAGTNHADPQSCTYNLTKSGSGYQVTTGKKDCNITYRKASVDGPYPLKAQVTWNVHWTTTTNPDSTHQHPGLPDGTSTHTQNVHVREIQNLN